MLKQVKPNRKNKPKKQKIKNLEIEPKILQRTLQTDILDGSQLTLSFWIRGIENFDFHKFNKKVHILSVKKADLVLLEVFYQNSKVFFSIIKKDNRKEEFSMNSRLDLKKFQLLTLTCNQTDFKLCLNNSLDLLLSYNKLYEGEESKSSKLRVEQYKTSCFKIMDLFVSKNPKIDF